MMPFLVRVASSGSNRMLTMSLMTSRGVKIDGGEFGNDEEEAVGFIELGDLVVEAEGVEDGADVGGEAADVAEEVLGDVVGGAAELVEIEFGGVVEALAGGFAEGMSAGGFAGVEKTGGGQRL